MEYLFDQSGESFHPTEDELDSMIDKGFVEEDEELASDVERFGDDLTTTLPVDLDNDEVCSNSLQYNNTH